MGVDFNVLMIKEARKELKRLWRGLEREWWRKGIKKCEEERARGRIGETYKWLRRLGTRGKSAAKGTFSLSDFRENLKASRKIGMKRHRNWLEIVVKIAVDLRNDSREKEANELLNEICTWEKGNQGSYERDSWVSTGVDSVRILRMLARKSKTSGGGCKIALSSNHVWGEGECIHWQVNL